MRHADKTHCTHGHEFSVGNTYVTANGWRVCRACQLVATRRHVANDPDAHRRESRESMRRFRERNESTDPVVVAYFSLETVLKWRALGIKI